MTRLKNGAYAQRIVVESRWRNKENNPPLHIERWFYFQVRDKSIVPLSPEDYERLTDSPRKGSAAPGTVERVYLGGDRAEATPLSKTMRSQAVRADSVDTLEEEHPRQRQSPGVCNTGSPIARKSASREFDPYD